MIETPAQRAQRQAAEAALRAARARQYEEYQAKRLGKPAPAAPLRTVDTVAAAAEAVARSQKPATPAPSPRKPVATPKGVTTKTHGDGDRRARYRERNKPKLAAKEAARRITANRCAMLDRIAGWPKDEIRSMIQSLELLLKNPADWPKDDEPEA